MNSPGSQTLVLITFLVFIALCLFLCVFTGVDDDDPAQFYTGARTLKPWQNGLAITGDYVSALTLLGTTGIIALTGFDGIMLACTTVLALAILMLLLAERLRAAGRYTVGDALARRFPGGSVRVAVGLAALALCLPYLVLQLSGVSTMMMFLLGLKGSGARTACLILLGVLMVSFAATAAATGQVTATLELTADITVGAATETVWGTLRGSGASGESIIANTHTDGPNATEENGGLALLALTRHLAALPSRNRDLHVALVTGHFQLPQFTAPIPNPRVEVGSDATSVWLSDHPDLAATAVVGVTLEHLGCTAWTNDPAGQYTATGGNEWSATYATQRGGSTGTTNVEQLAYLAAVDAVNADGWSDTPVATVLPGALPLYLGEGAPLYASGLGTVSLCPAPTYLLQAGDPRCPELLDLDKLDRI